MRCTIWYDLRNLKNVKNTHGGVSPFVKLQATKSNTPSNTLLACNFTKSNTPSWVFFMFFKLYKWYQIAQNITYAINKNFNLPVPDGESALGGDGE